MVKAAFAAALTAGLATTAAIGVSAGVNPKEVLTCVQPLDAASIDAVLTRAGSPLAGEGRTFVNSAAAWGLDPRALIAIATHETILETYAPAAAINNPFGIGPGRAFATNADAIAFAAELLAKHYVGEGRTTLEAISGKWAPIGVANDPTNLNANWTTGVGAAYTRLGGDPAAPITLNGQATVACQAPATVPQPAGTPGQPAAGAIAWNGQSPIVAEPLMERGADPATGLAATITGFMFPFVPNGTPIAYDDDFGQAGTPGCYGRQMRCATSVVTVPGVTVVAAAAGILAAATADEQASGIAFWVVTGAGDRVGYSGLASYAPGIADQVTVSAGQALGTSTRTTLIAWERAGQRINAYPLLSATFPAQA